MKIQCTKKLLDMLPTLPGSPDDHPGDAGPQAAGSREADPLFGWHANLVKVGRRQMLLMLNDYSRYPLFVYGVKRADLKNLPALFQQALTEIWLADGIDQPTVDRYLDLAGPIRITRSGSRSYVSNMVQLALDLPFYLDEPGLLDESRLIQTRLSMRFSDRSEKIGRHFLAPREALDERLERLEAGDAGGTGEAGTESGTGAAAGDRTRDAAADDAVAFILRVELSCCTQSIWRRIAVPAETTFSQFHQILQACFNWQNCHLHLFQILDDQGEIVAESKSSFAEGEYLFDNASYERFSGRKKLSRYLPANRRLTYTYDFGDDWLHLIELEQTVDSFNGDLPVCLDGAGEAPPEDVGGESGFEAFLEMVRLTDTDRKAAKAKAASLAWAKSQGWQPYDRDVINQRLKKIGSTIRRA